MRVDQTKLREELKHFINFNQVRQQLSLNFDNMCMHILSNYGRDFSPSELERVCDIEFKKFNNLPICPEMYTEIARYIDDMTMYMHQRGELKGAERNEKLQKRFQQYTEDLARAKHKKR